MFDCKKMICSSWVNRVRRFKLFEAIWLVDDEMANVRVWLKDLGPIS